MQCRIDLFFITSHDQVTTNSGHCQDGSPSLYVLESELTFAL